MAYNTNWYKMTGQKVPSAQLTPEQLSQAQNYRPNYNISTGNNNQSVSFGSNWLQGYLNQQSQLGNQLMQQGQNLQAASDMGYDAQMAQSNFYYSSAIQDLQRSREQALQVGRTNAIALNPYAQARGASTAANFDNAVMEKFSLAESRIRQQADLAMQSLMAGKYQDAARIQAQIAQQVNQVQKETYSALFDVTRAAEQQRQFGITTAINQSDKAQDNLRSFIQTSGVSQSLIDNPPSWSDPAVWNRPDISMYSQYALSQGLSPQEAITTLPALLSGQTIAQQRLSLQQTAQLLQEQWRDNQLALGWARLAETQAKQTAQEKVSAVIQSVGSVPYPGKDASDEDWVNYYKQLAMASAGGKTDFRIAETMSNLQSTIAQLPNVKAGIEALDDTPLRNIVARYATPFSVKVSLLEGEISRILGTVARGIMSEKGVLTDADIKRAAKAVGMVSQKSEVRNKLWNELVNIMTEKYQLNLGGYTRQGYDLSAYASTIDTIYALKLDSQVSEKAKTRTLNFGGYQPPSWLKSDYGVTIPQ